MKFQNNNKLKYLRDDIDELDSAILELISKRFELAKKILEIKLELGVSNEEDLRDFAREQEVLSRCSSNAEQEVFTTILKVSHALQVKGFAASKGEENGSAG